jgi:Putative transposase
LVSHSYLGEQFRIRLSGLLRRSCERGHLCDNWGEVLSSERLGRVLRKAQVRNSWIVGIEKGLRNVEQIIGYVGRYTKRACISVYKIVEIGDGRIGFKYNDYANTPRGEKPVVAVKAQSMGSFLDSLLQHVPNKGFQGVRYGGVYANASQKYIPKAFLSPIVAENAEIKLAELGEGTDIEVEQYESYRKNQVKLYGNDPFMCSCGTKMSFVCMYIDGKRLFGKIKEVKIKDTS